MNDYNNVLVGFSELIKNEEFRPYEGDLRLGVDLGTANIVVSVVDSNNTPIAGASYPSTVVRDGIVVDFMGASRAVRNMKAKLEDLMGVEFYEAATAIPPGIISGNVKVISNVVESVGLDVVNVIDELQQPLLFLVLRTEQSWMSVVEQPVSVFSKTERLSLPQMSLQVEHT